MDVECQVYTDFNLYHAIATYLVYHNNPFLDSDEDSLYLKIMPTIKDSSFHTHQLTNVYVVN